MHYKRQALSEVRRVWIAGESHNSGLVHTRGEGVYVEAVSGYEVIEISTSVANLYFEAIITKKVNPVMCEVMGCPRYEAWSIRQALEKTAAVANDLNKEGNNSATNSACGVRQLRRILHIASTGKARLVVVLFITDTT